MCYFKVSKNTKQTFVLELIRFTILNQENILGTFTIIYKAETSSDHMLRSTWNVIYVVFGAGIKKKKKNEEY